MRHTTLILLSLFLTFYVNIAEAQKKQKYSKHLANADKAYDTDKFFNALDLYKKAYSKAGKDRKLKAKIMFQVAMCYKKMNDMKRAASWFKRAVTYKYPDPIASYYYAKSLKILEKYDEAREAFKAYKDINPEDTTINKELEALELAKKWIENPTRYEISNKEIRKLNSKEHDFSPDYADSKYRTLIFTSSRDGSKGSGEDDWTGHSFQDLYFVKKDRKKSWKTPIPFTESINSEHHEGGASLNENGTEIFFTRCMVQKNKQMGCQIFKAKKTGKAWEEAELFDLVGDSSITVAHPALSADETKLFFVSDMRGSIGGKDIWMVEIDGVKPGEPTNLGPIINTTADEMFPYAAKDDILYFASDGHLGMGGLDIFKSEYIDGEWTKPENMKYPVNSSYDDFGIVLEENNEKGFITSNRKGSRGGDDIWELYLPPLVFTMNGTVYDDSTQEVIKNSIVKISGTDGTSYIAYSDEEGKYYFNEMQIQANTTYDMSASFKGYFSETGKETTIGYEHNKDIEHDFYLKRIPDQPIELPEILYDLARWDLKKQYKDSLNGLVKTMYDNPTFVIELASHTDSRASDVYNDTLSQKRAQSVVDYLIEKGIAAERMVAKGYGEKSPKELKKKVIYPQVFLQQGTFMKNDTIISGVAIKKGLLYTDVTIDSVVFNAGTILNEEFINSLETTRAKELAHQLNRRTEFSVISEDYLPKDGEGLNIPKMEIIRNKEGKGNDNE